MTEIIFATPTSPQRLLWVRFGGAWLTVMSVYAFATVVLLLTPLVLPVSADRMGAVHPSYYFWAFLTYVIPTLTVIMAVLFAVALMTRNALATMVAAVVMYGAYLIISAISGSPIMAASKAQSAAAMTTAALVDPFGITAFYQQARYWTADMRNTRVIALTGTYLGNRLIWLAVASVVLAIVHRIGLRSRERTPSSRGSRLSATAAVVQTTSSATAPASSARYSVAFVGPVQGGHALRAALDVGRMDARYVLTSWPALVIMVVWGILIATEALSATQYSEYGTELMRTSAILVEALQQPLLLFGAVILIFFGPEVVWRARGARMDALLDATPTGNAVRYAGHFVALSAMAAVLTLVAIGVAMALQVAQHEAPIVLPVYLSLFATGTLPLVLFVAAVMFVQVLSPNRYVGTLGALTVAMTQHGWAPFGIDHPLLRFAATPTWVYSDLAGFGEATTSFVAFMAFWILFAALLGSMSVALWHRGHPTSVRTRFAVMTRSAPSSARFALVILVLCTVGAASGLAFTTIRENRYLTTVQARTWQAAYEKAYSSRIVMSPNVYSIAASVALYPRERRYTIAGQSLIVNASALPIDTVWVAVPRESDSVVATLNGQSPAMVDSVFGMRAFVPVTPMVPGDSAVLHYAFVRDESGVRAEFPSSGVRPNGTYLELRRVLPSVGFRLSYTIPDSTIRAEYGLAPLDTSVMLDQVMLQWIDLTVSTSVDQIPVTSGTLVHEDSTNWRRTRAYHLAGPIPDGVSIASARYQVATAVAGDVALEIYYHPGHRDNIPRMMVAAQRSLQYMTGHFSPYPHRTLRIAEVPSSFPAAAFATPGAIYFAEDRGFLTRAPKPKGLDLVARRTAHEVAHQWWGHQLAPPRAPGNLLLVESFAKYIEQRVVAELQDESRSELIRAYDHERYLQGRTSAEGTEPSLSTMGSDDYLFYGKGAIVMAAVRDLVGETHLEQTMQSMLPVIDSIGVAPTAPEFLRRLQHGLTDADSALVGEWLAGVALYDLTVDSAIVQPKRVAVGNGDSVLVELRAYTTANKFLAQPHGEQPMPMNERISFTVTSSTDNGDRTWYAGRHQLQSGVNIVVLAWPMLRSSDSLPVGLRVNVDPGFLRIDRERTNNSAPVARKE